MTEIQIAISGMTCGHCVSRVSKALGALPGVRVDSVEVGSAHVAFEAAAISRDRVLAAIRDLGYGAEAPEAA
jgi:copper chaperone CopZ